jgi:hypothetical protein
LLSRSLGHTIWLPFLLGALCSDPALCQDRSFSIVGSAGYGFLSLEAVDAKNASDVVGWANLGIPVNDFASVKRSPFFSGRMTYRYTRDFAVSLYGSYFSESVSSSYEGPEATLHLDRSVAATDLSLGISYYPALQPYVLEWYIRVNFGLILARASARALGEAATKPGGVIVMVPPVDSDGKYTKAKTFAGFFVGADVPLSRQIFLTGEAGYRVAQVGQLDGDITRSGVQSVEMSSTTFDYSGILLGIGLGIKF